jgi:hypothetical protein
VGIDVEELPDSSLGLRGWVLSRGGEPLVTLVVRTGIAAEVGVYRGDEARPAGFYSPRYLVRRPVPHLRVSVNARTAMFTTHLVASTRSWAEVETQLGGWR